MAPESKDKLLLGAVCFQEYPRGYLEFLDLASELNLSWVEFKYESPIKGRNSSRTYQEIRIRARERKIGLSMHTAFVGLNIASLDRAERISSLKMVEESLSAAAEMEISKATLHAGHLPCVDYSEKNWLDSQRYNIESISTLLEVAGAMGISLCLENGNGYGKSTLKHALFPGDLKLIQKYVDGKLFFTLDFGHGQFQSRNPSFLVSELGEENVLLSHLHSNSGLEDSHSPLGTGILDLDSILRTYIQRKWMFPLSIEMKSESNLRQSLEFLRTRLDFIQEHSDGNY